MPLNATLIHSFVSSVPRLRLCPVFFLAAVRSNVFGHIMAFPNIHTRKDPNTEFQFVAFASALIESDYSTSGLNQVR